MCARVQQTRWGKTGDARATEALCASLRDDINKLVRIAAATALGDIGDARAVASLSAALKDRDGGVRYAAKGALKKLDVRVD